METRRLVKSGNTSFTMALPIDWIRKNRLDSGNEVIVSESSQGDLVISAVKTEQQISVPETIHTIRIDDKTEARISIEMLISYIRDSKTVIFEGKQIAAKNRFISDKVANFIGFDIMEQGENFIKVKNFYQLDIETSPETIIGKINVINRAAYSLLSKTFDWGMSESGLFEIQKFHEQNKKLSFLAEKGSELLISDPNLTKKLRTNEYQVIIDKKIISIFSHISSRLYHLARALQLIDMKSMEAKELKKIFKETETEYDDSTNLLFHRNKDNTIDTIQRLQKSSKRLDEIINLIDDPLVIQALMSLLFIKINLKEMLYELLR